jgi:hypothetical protein
LWIESNLTLDGGTADASEVQLETTTRWIDSKTMEFDVIADLAVPEGVFDLHVANVDGQADVLEEAFVSVPPPVGERMEPQLLCIEQDDKPAVMIGTQFLGIGGETGTVNASNG